MSRKSTPTYETEKAPFPTNLRDIMREKKKSQADLASKLGVTRQTISLYMTGQSSPNAEQIIKIAKELNVSSDCLLGLAKNPTTDAIDRVISNQLGLSALSVAILREAHTDRLSKTLNVLIEGEFSQCSMVGRAYTTVENDERKLLESDVSISNIDEYMDTHYDALCSPKKIVSTILKSHPELENIQSQLIQMLTQKAAYETRQPILDVLQDYFCHRYDWSKGHDGAIKINNQQLLTIESLGENQRNLSDRIQEFNLQGKAAYYDEMPFDMTDILERVMFDNLQEMLKKLKRGLDTSKEFDQ